MTDISPYAVQNYFTGRTLDRASAQRVRAAEVTQLLVNKTARFLPFWRRQHLFSCIDSHTKQSSLAKCTLTQLGLSLVDLSDHCWVFLGNDDRAPVFGIDISSIDDAAARVAGTDFFFAEFRPFQLSACRVAISDSLRWRGVVHDSSQSSFGPA